MGTSSKEGYNNKYEYNNKMNVGNWLHYPVKRLILYDFFFWAGLLPVHIMNLIATSIEFTIVGVIIFVVIDLFLFLAVLVIIFLVVALGPLLALVGLTGLLIYLIVITVKNYT